MIIDHRNRATQLGNALVNDTTIVEGFTLEGQEQQEPSHIQGQPETPDSISPAKNQTGQTRLRRVSRRISSSSESSDDIPVNSATHLLTPKRGMGYQEMLNDPEFDLDINSEEGPTILSEIQPIEAPITMVNSNLDNITSNAQNTPRMSISSIWRALT